MKTKTTRQLWLPETDYFFTDEACYPNQSMALLMFLDHPYLVELFETIMAKTLKLSFSEQQTISLNNYLKLSQAIENKSKLHQYLDFFLRQGEKAHERHNLAICPYCNKKTVTSFVLVNQVSYGFCLDSESLFCGQAKCYEKAKYLTARKHRGGKARRLLTFSLFDLTSVFTKPTYKATHQSRVMSLFAQAFNLPEVLDAKTAFKFFVT